MIDLDKFKGNIMNRKQILLRVVAILFFLYICLVYGSYFLTIKTEGYSFSVTTLHKSLIVREAVGPLKNMRLAFTEYSVRHSGPNIYAEFKIYITGEKRKGTVYLNVKKDIGVWQVVKGSLILDNKETISLVAVAESKNEKCREFENK